MNVPEIFVGDYLKKKVTRVDCDWMTSLSIVRVAGSDSGYVVNATKVRIQGIHPTFLYNLKAKNHLTGSIGNTYSLNSVQIPIHTNRETIHHYTPLKIKVIAVTYQKKHIIKWNIWESVPCSTGTTSILIHISTLILWSKFLPSKRYIIGSGGLLEGGGISLL